MSKKVMKRSLVLGALMAFVITGSAFAETLGTDGGTTNLERVWVYSGDTYVDNVINPAKTNEVIDVVGNNINFNKNGSVVFLRVNSYSGTDKSAVVNIGTDDTKLINVNFGNTGLYAEYANAVINVKGEKLYLSSTADGARGLHSSNNGSIPAANKSKIIISEKTHTVIDVNENSYGITAFSGGTVEINGGLEMSAGAAVVTRGNSNVEINKSGNGVVKIDGDIWFNPTGNSDVDGANSNVNINLTTSDSYLNGASYVHSNKSSHTKENVSDFTVALSNGATWNVTEDSFVNTLAGNGGNVVLATVNDSFDVAALDISTKNANANLTISGDDKLTEAIEKGAISGEVAVQKLASAVTNEGADTKEVKTVKTAEGKVIGSYVLNEDGKAELQENSKSAAVSEAGMNLKAHWRAHMNDMNKRMGELRFANGETGVWTRMVRGESEYEGAKMQYNQYQLGYDEKLSVDKRWTVGAAVTFSEGDSSYSTGSSEDKSTAFAIYGSKLNNDGTFVDLIARYARLESDIEDRTYEKGEYDTNGMSVSAEFGKRIQQGNGLWIEPQVELTYGTVDSASVRFTDGSVADYGDMNSFIGRVGFSLGKDIKQGNVYARASYLYDFDGETETIFNNGTISGKPVEEDFGGGWWEVGVGANINLSEATYIYADVEKTFGGEVDTNWQWNLGVRYSF